MRTFNQGFVQGGATFDRLEGMLVRRGPDLLRCLTPAGEAFEFAVNRLNDGEWAGACFSPSGRTLFANRFGDGSSGSGMTVAITGPWSAGPL